MSIEEQYKLKSLDFLKTLPTPRLLAYYRKERMNIHRFFCSCCGTPMWEIDKFYKEEEYKEWLERLENIKAILNTREHVERK